MRKIIVPVDFSASSIRAVKNAVTLAKKMSGEIGIIHVNRVHSFSAIFGSHKTAESVGTVEKNMEQLVKEIDFRGVPYSTTLRTGSAPKEIATYAEEASGFLVAVGTDFTGKGESSTWIGDDINKIITSSPCPVMTMPMSDKLFDIRKIIIPIDTTITTRHKVPFTAELASAFKAQIIVLGTCVDESPEFVSKLQGYCYQVRRYLNQVNVPSEYDFMVGSNIGKMSIEYAKKVNADLISIMTEQETSIMGGFKGTPAEQMVHQSPVPTLSMHKVFEVERFEY